MFFLCLFDSFFSIFPFFTTCTSPIPLSIESNPFIFLFAALCFAFQSIFLLQPINRLSPFSIPVSITCYSPSLSLSLPFISRTPLSLSTFSPHFSTLGINKMSSSETTRLLFNTSLHEVTKPAPTGHHCSPDLLAERPEQGSSFTAYAVVVCTVAGKNGVVLICFQWLTDWVFVNGFQMRILD